MANDLKSITQKVIMVKESENIYKMQRLQELLKVLGDQKTAIVFTNTKESADSITKALNKVQYRVTTIHADSLTKALNKAKYRVTTIHGDKSPSERKSSLDGFSKKIYNVLVSTEEAGRGIELPDHDGVHVINYDFPANIDIYIRQTSLAGKKTGRATTFFTLSRYRYGWTDNDDLLGEIVQMLIQSKSYVQPVLRRYCQDNDVF